MGIFNSLGNAISSVCNIIGSTFSSVGSGISKFATKLIAPLPPQLYVAIQTIILVAEIVSTVAEVLGLKPENETAEELGAKAKEADLNRSDFESTEKYIQYLRDEVALDNEKFEKMSPEERLACQAVGVGLYASNINEKVGVELSPEFLLKAAKLEMKAMEIKAYMDAFKDSGFGEMKYMSDFLTGKLDEKTDNKVESAIIEGLKNINPDINEKDIQSKIADMTKVALEPEGN